MSSESPQNEPLPIPPFVPIEGMFNVRDIGGYEIPTIFGRSRSIRRGLIYRGGEPSRITPQGRATFKALSIEKIFDIRTKEELPSQSEDTGHIFENLRQPIVELDGAERIHIDVFADAIKREGIPTAQTFQDFEKNSIERFLAKGIEVFDNGMKLRPIFDHLTKKDPSPIYLHCTGGKDRTGTVVLLLFRLAGVSPETAAEEYQLTNLGLRKETPRLVEMVLKNPQMGLDAETLKKLTVAKKMYIEKLSKALDEKYGGAEHYFRSHLKMTAADVQAIKGNLIANERPIFKKRMEAPVSTSYLASFCSLA